MYDKNRQRNLLPAGSQRGETYNPMMAQIEKLTDTTKTIAEAHGVGPAHIPVAWSIAKGTMPIICVTSVSQVNDTIISCNLSSEGIQLFS